jgi:hypothetical protein
MMFNFKIIFDYMRKAINRLSLTKTEKVIVSLMLVLLLANYIKFEFSLVGITVFGYVVTQWMAFGELITPTLCMAAVLACVWSEN